MMQTFIDGLRAALGNRILTHVESTPLVGTMEVSKSRGSQQGAALMQRSTKYVALDVHQATTVAAVRAANGRVIARAVLPTEDGALRAFFGGMRGAIHVAFEEGTQTPLEASGRRADSHDGPESDLDHRLQGPVPNAERRLLLSAHRHRSLQPLLAVLPWLARRAGQRGEGFVVKQ